MVRFERLGLKPEEVGLEDRLLFIEHADRSTPFAEVHLVDSMLWEQAYSRAVAAICYFLVDNTVDAQKIGAEALRRTEDYFFGEWRRTFKAEEVRKDPEYWRRYGPWMSLFEECLFLAATLDHWDQLRALAQYPNQDCRLDVDSKREERFLLLAIAEYLRSNKLTGNANDYLEHAISGKATRPALLAQLLRAIAARSIAASQQHFAAYLRHYKTREFPGRDITKKLCLMGSFFAALARRNEIPLEVPDGYADYLVLQSRANGQA